MDIFRQPVQSCGGDSGSKRTGMLLFGRVARPAGNGKVTDIDKENKPALSRRKMLKGLGASLGAGPMLLHPAPVWGAGPSAASGNRGLKPDFPDGDVRFRPHYPIQPALGDVLRLVPPGSDEYITEKYAFEIGEQLKGWGESMRRDIHDTSRLKAMLSDHFAASLVPAYSKVLRSAHGIQVTERGFGQPETSSPEQLLKEFSVWLNGLSRLEVTEFDIYDIQTVTEDPLIVNVGLRYDLVGSLDGSKREERVGMWRMTLARQSSGAWCIHRWESKQERCCIGPQVGFVDVTAQALGGTESYAKQMLHGVDYWRTVLDGACGIDIYANNGVAAGDYDNDGFDDLYVCQPGGLPNRLYRNRGDGTFEDVTEKANVGVLDNTACAMFADLENRGLQDLIVVCGGGPLLLRNQGDGTFQLKRDAFEFANAPEGTFTHAAVADYDGDGRLDIYFCTYQYYLGLDQYHYPVPYYDARNGPPNYLMHNEGNGKFVEKTVAAGMDVENNRYSFACAWGYSGEKGLPDLVIANDFGTSQLYRNNGDGTFSFASKDSHIEDVGAGMSACWSDVNNDGHADIYITSMWEAAGQRVSGQAQFHEAAAQATRTLYQRHARGNALYRNSGDGTFENDGQKAGVAMGRWSWSADFWDIDHDGFADLYVTDGYISGPERTDIAGFFWRQVVAKSPEDGTSMLVYERGWNAMNELVRSDKSWNGLERNVVFLNHGDGNFSEASGVLGLDCIEDGRSFALADIDHDGRLEVIVKNRNAPQLRVLRNAMKEIGDSIILRLRGHKSNRDAIGATVTLECGNLTQTRYLQAGTGFLAQHSKEMCFGLGKTVGVAKATVRWPSGLVQSFDGLQRNRRIVLEEGIKTFADRPFAEAPAAYARESTHDVVRKETLPEDVETWLISPLQAPMFELPDAGGTVYRLKDFFGNPTLLHFWASSAPKCREQLRRLQEHKGALDASGLKVLAINADSPADIAAARKVVAEERVSFPTLFATEEVAGIYNIIFRYLYDRRRDLALPTSFLLNADGKIVKVYQGALDPLRIARDARGATVSAAEQITRALPFRGELLQGAFQRNDFTYGVALFQHGYLDPAAESFEQVLRARPNDPEAYYNLGTLNLRRNSFALARTYLEKTLELRPNYPEAWNNLGMMSAQGGDAAAAVTSFQKALELRPAYEIALMNLGNVYRRQGQFTKAEESLSKALKIQPDDPEVNYNLGMLHAQQNDLSRASDYLQRAIALRPIYPEALNNLGIVYVRLRYLDKAEQMFKTGMEVAPDNDQAYLNMARLAVIQKDKAAARQVLEKLLKRQPGNDAATKALEVLR